MPDEREMAEITDAQRLDWLERRCGTYSEQRGATHTHEWSVFLQSAERRMSLREVIDHHMGIPDAR